MPSTLRRSLCFFLLLAACGTPPTPATDAPRTEAAIEERAESDAPVEEASLDVVDATAADTVETDQVEEPTQDTFVAEIPALPEPSLDAATDVLDAAVATETGPDGFVEAATDVVADVARDVPGDVATDVLSPGCNLPLALQQIDVRGTVTLGGAALPTSTTSSETLLFYLRAQDTGALHLVHSVGWGGSGPFSRSAGTESFSSRIMPGTYDLLYSRGHSTASNTVRRTDAMESVVHGYRVLRSGISALAGALLRLDIDIPVASARGTVTRGGMTLPTSTTSSETLLFYLRAQDTGALHLVHSIGWGGSGPFSRSAGTESFSSRIMPGTYDLLYSRGHSTTSNTVRRTDAMESVVHGYRVLRSGISISAGAMSTLDIDIPVSNVSGTVTQGGTALPTSSTSSETLLFYLRSQDTGALHLVHSVGWGGSGPFSRSTGSENFSSQIMPGTYDLLYSRGQNSTSNTVRRTDAMESVVHGYRVLRSGISINAGAMLPLNIDIPVARVQGTVTQNSAALPVSSASSETLLFYLRAQDTGALHLVHSVGWGGSGPFSRSAGSESFSSRIMPGTYDLLYSRGHNSTSNTVRRTDAMESVVHGYRVLRSGISINAGATATLPIDLGASSVQGTVTLNGAALPRSTNSSETLLFYLQASDTGVLHLLHSVGWGGSGPFSRSAGTESYSSRIMPGTYNLLYERGASGTENAVRRTDAAEPVVHAYRLLRSGISIAAGSPTTIDLPLTSLRISGTVTLQAAALPMMTSSSETMLFYLRSQDTGALHLVHSVGWGGSGPFSRSAGTESFSSQIMPGTYDLLYSRGYSSASNSVRRTDVTEPIVHARRVLRTGLSFLAGGCP